MKKLLFIILIMCFALTLCSCSGNKKADGSLSTPTAPNTSLLTSRNITDSTIHSIETSSVEPKHQLAEDTPEFKQLMENIIYEHTRRNSPEECISTAYSEKELLLFIKPLSHKNITTLSQLNERYPLEFLIKLDNEKYGFVYKLSEGGYLQGVAIMKNEIYGRTFVVENISIVNDAIVVESFDSIKTGKSSIEEVETIDVSLARMNKVTTDHLLIGNYTMEKQQSDEYSLPYTLHSTSNGMVCITYERPDKNNGKYVVKERRILETAKLNGLYWFGYTYGELGIDYEKLYPENFK